MKYFLSVACLLLILNSTEAQKKVNWLSWDDAVAAATDSPKKMYIDIYTDWCGYCKKMDRETFTDPKVIKYLNENFYPVKFDAEQKEIINFNGTEFKHRPGGRGGVHELAAALLNNQLGYPAFVILDEEFSRILISPGYKGADDVIMEMEFAKEEKYKEKSWNAFKAEHVAMKRAAAAKVAKEQMANRPATTTKPATPGKPSNATVPANRAKGSTATVPVRPAKPSTATVPAKPATTGKPADPSSGRPINPNTPTKPTTPTKPNNSNDDDLYKVVEEMPRFPGCENQGDKEEKKKCAEDKMNQHLYQNLAYPKIARENGIDGMVVLQFVIEKDGKISNAKIIRDIGAGCGEAALNVVNSMPAWIPGKQRGKNVRVLYTMPVRFKLEKGKNKKRSKKNKVKAADQKM